MSSPIETDAASRRRDLAAIRDTWLAAGLSTARAERAEAEAAARALYRSWHLPAPSIVWCESPRELVRLACRQAGRASGAELIGTAVRQKFAAPLLHWYEAALWNEADAVRDAVDARVWRGFGRLVETGAVTADLAGQWPRTRPALTGHCDVPLLALHAALASRGPVLGHLSALAALAGWALTLGRACFIAERPLLVRTDDRGRLHCLDGPAVLYSDGFAVHALAGVAVPERMVAEPTGIRPDDIDRETNPEVRRVLLERFGFARFLAATAAMLVNEDETGRLWMRRLRHDAVSAWVEVVNGTPEADGRHRHYFLQVPPTCVSAREAVAWTYGLQPEEYTLAART